MPRATPGSPESGRDWAARPDSGLSTGTPTALRGDACRLETL